MKNLSNVQLSKQGGFSLVELMIAGILGLLLLGGVLQLFTGSNQNYRMQDELAGIQENGRFAMMFLNNQIEMAGWSDPAVARVEPAIDFINSSEGGGLANDSIAITFVAAVDAANTDNRDCNNNVVADGIVTNQFFVNGNNELSCRGMGGGGAGQPLIDGVESFQVLYGVETERVCPDGVVDKYMTHTEVVNAGLTENILAVRVAVVLASDDEILTDIVDQFDVLDQVVVPADRNLRRVFQRTISMPNSGFNLLVTSDAAVKCMSGF